MRFKLLNFITNGIEDRVNLALKALIFPLVSKGEVNLKLAGYRISEAERFALHKLIEPFQIERTAEWQLTRSP